MPTNAVYQPTTVQFENSGMHFQTSAGSRLKSFFRKTYMQVLLLILGLLFLTTGIVLTASAAADYEDVEEFKENITSPVVEEETDIGLMVLGVFFTIFGFVLLGESSFICMYVFCLPEVSKYVFTISTPLFSIVH